MKHDLKLNNSESNVYFESDSGFNSVIIRNIKYSNPKDTQTLLFNWLYGPFGAIFSIPISESFAQQIDDLNLISMAKSFDEPFNGPFSRLDIKLNDDFDDDSSEISFEIELK